MGVDDDEEKGGKGVSAVRCVPAAVEGSGVVQIMPKNKENENENSVGSSHLS